MFRLTLQSHVMTEGWGIRHRDMNRRMVGCSTPCHWVLLFVCCFSRSVVSDSLQPPGLYPARLLCPWDFPGRNTGVGCHAFSKGPCMCVLSCFSHIQLCATLRTVACQTSQSMGFFSQESLSGLPCPPPGNLPDPGIKPESFTTPALACEFFTTSATWEAPLGSFSSVAQSCLTLKPHGLQQARLPCPSPTPGTCSNSCPLS